MKYMCIKTKQAKIYIPKANTHYSLTLFVPLGSFLSQLGGSGAVFQSTSPSSAASFTSSATAACARALAVGTFTVAAWSGTETGVAAADDGADDTTGRARMRLCTSPSVALSICLLLWLLRSLWPTSSPLARKTALDGRVGRRSYKQEKHKN